MPKLNTLPADWPGILTDQARIPLGLSVNYDPDGDDLTFDGEKGLVKIDPVIFGPSFDFESLFNVALTDISATFSNADDYFNSISGDFRRNFRILASMSSTTAASLRPGLFDFEVDDVVLFSDGDGSESATIATVSGDNITFSAVSRIFTGGGAVSLFSVAGRTVNFDLKLGGSSNSFNVFSGLTRGPFTTSGPQATLYVDNKLGLALDYPLEVQSGSLTPLQGLNGAGSFESSISWTVQSGSGVLSEGGVTVYSGSTPGRWYVEFTSSTEFKVSGPGTQEKVGATSGDFYDGTFSYNSQIKIAAAAWSGTPSSGDIVEFYVCVNFSGDRPAEMILDLLKDYAKIDTTKIDVSPSGITAGTSGDLKFTFNKCYSVITDTRNACFSSGVTIGEAIATILEQELLTISGGVFGRIRIQALNPGFTMESVDIYPVELPEITYSDVINFITINYGSSYDDPSYIGSVKYPATDAQNPSYQVFNTRYKLEVNAGFIHTETEALELAKKIYSIFKVGVVLITVVCDLRNLATDVGDYFSIAIGNPSKTISQAVVYQTERHYGNENKVILRAFAGGFMSDEDNAWQQYSSLSSSYSSASQSESASSRSRSTSASGSSSQSSSQSSSTSSEPALKVGDVVTILKGGTFWAEINAGYTGSDLDGSTGSIREINDDLYGVGIYAPVIYLIDDYLEYVSG